MWLEATISTKKLDITKNSGNIPSLAKKFAESEVQNITEWKNKIQNLDTQGKVAIWGAGAKGVTFANLIDPKHKWIDCVIDLNPKKHGKYIPGTGHEIVSHKDITSRKIKTAVLMNPNYYDEITELLNNTNLNVDLVV